MVAAKRGTVKHCEGEEPSSSLLSRLPTKLQTARLAAVSVCIAAVSVCSVSINPLDQQTHARLSWVAWCRLAYMNWLLRAELLSRGDQVWAGVGQDESILVE